jgi:Zn-dependent protease with chaperone function
MSTRAVVVGALVAAILLGGCALETASTAPTAGQTEASKPAPPAKQPTAAQKTVDPIQVERLKKAMIPLLQAMDKPRPPSRVKVGIVDDPEINAANAGNGEFYVTTGLLEKANDEQLLAVMAHEVAHEDLGHVAKAQALGAGIGVRAVILDRIELLKRVGGDKDVMISTLTWLMNTAGDGGGGFLSTHPATGDRIEVLRRL